MTVAVIGAGNSGLAMAAHLSKLGCEVHLWNRTKKNIEQIIRSKVIFCDGIGIGEALLANATDNLAEAIDDAAVIMITTPADSFEDIGRLLAKNMRKNVPIVLNPGRTFGAFRLERILKLNGLAFTPDIAETQTILYACRKISADSVKIYSLKDKVRIASIRPEAAKRILEILPDEFSKSFEIEESVVKTSLCNVGMILHCAPLLLNSGWTENGDNSYKYYYDGITPIISSFLEKMDRERIKVAESIGYTIESTAEWLKRSYGVTGDSLYECIRNNNAYKKIDAPNSLKHRYISEDVPFGLVQIEKIGNKEGVCTEYISLIIDLAEHLIGENYRQYSEWINDEFVNAIKRGNAYERHDIWSDKTID